MTDNPAPNRLSRRSFLAGSLASIGAAATLGGCGSMLGFGSFVSDGVYGPVGGERFPIPAVDVSDVPRHLLREEVDYRSDEPAGTIVVDLANFHLYRVDGGGKATRYGINTPKDEFLWTGAAEIKRKAEWPVWTPTRDQVGRDPTLVRYAGGMPPGLDNPLGARAMYLYQNGADTLCRIYGTDQAWTLGKRVSSGCIGLLNQDVIHLYERTALDTRVVILPAVA